MFDDLRQQAGSEAVFENPEEEKEDSYSFKGQPRKSSGRILGMTPVQRFIIAIILLLTSCLLSSFCLIVTGRIWLI